VTRGFEGRVSKLLDVSEKLLGTVIILNDVTDHKILTTRLDHLAKTDGLTRTNNRRHFLELAQHEVLRARRHNRQLSLMVIEVDHFKAINDRHGHGAGDEALFGLTQTMLGTPRVTDSLGRLGGEEFSILLPETSAQAAVTAAERLRARVEALELATGAGPLRLTVSVGTATLTPSDRTFEQLLRRADHALYRARDLGRNRVEMAGDPAGGAESFPAPLLQSRVLTRPEDLDLTAQLAGRAGRTTRSRSGSGGRAAPLRSPIIRQAELDRATLAVAASGRRPRRSSAGAVRSHPGSGPFGTVVKGSPAGTRRLRPANLPGSG
jgi:diguanylate cyclase (GGDEF)-like protein